MKVRKRVKWQIVFRYEAGYVIRKTTNQNRHRSNNLWVVAE